MQRLRVVPALRERLGDHGTEALIDMVYTTGQEWRDDVLNTVTSRFEGRLAHELSTFRVGMSNDLADMRVETLRWSFMFWITQLAAMAGFLAYMR